MRGIAVFLGYLAASGALAVERSDSAPPQASIDTSTLTFEFPNAMEIWGNRSDVSVGIEPEIPTKCFWSDDRTLYCRFPDDLSATLATHYRVILPADLVTQDGAHLPEQIFDLETARPTLGAFISEWNKGVPSIIVYGANASNTDTVTSSLRLLIDGKPAPVVLQSFVDKYDRHQRFAVLLPPIHSENAQIELRVVPGLIPDTGTLRGTQNDILKLAIANEPFRMRSVRCETPPYKPKRKASKAEEHYCAPGQFDLVFSQKPDTVSLAGWIKTLPKGVAALPETSAAIRNHAEPKNPYERAPSYRVPLVLKQARITTKIVLPPTMVGETGNLGQQVEVSITTSDHPPALSAPYLRNLLDSQNLPRSLARAVNTDRAHIETLAVDDDAMRATFEIRNRRDNKHRSIHSIPTDRALKNGGWSSWVVASPEPKERWGRTQPEFAAPDFDLLAVAGRNEVLVWANRWETGEPLGGVALDLLALKRSNNSLQVRARGTTASDGVARLVVSSSPPDSKRETLDQPRWFVRGTHAQARLHSVLPIDRRFLFESAPKRLWGVTERPIYRAGDTVRYRLWQRDLMGGRLLATQQPLPSKLELRESTYDSKMILNWATPDAQNGNVHGEITLPSELVDGMYCIGASEESSDDGACFYSGSYRSQDLWADSASSNTLLRDGETLSVDISAGYYSGGPASNIAITNIQTMLTSLPLEEAYPEFEQFRFLDVVTEDGVSGIELEGAATIHTITDSLGKTELRLPVAFKPRNDGKSPNLPAFGRIQVTAEARLDDREGTTTPAAQAFYARHDRFVGLRMEPRWPSSSEKISIEGIVIDAHGKPVVDQSLDISIHFRKAYSAGEEKESEALAQCTIPSGKLSECDFPRARSGWYTIMAKSGNSAPSKLERYIAASDNAPPSGVVATKLQLLESASRPGEIMRISLTQPFPDADALFVYSKGDQILTHQVQPLNSTVTTLALATPSETSGKLALRVWIREKSSGKSRDDGFRAPPKVTATWIEIDAASVTAPPPIKARFETSEARPGSVVPLIVRNESDTARDVVVSVMDDAIRALAKDYLPYSDPHSDSWLGGLHKSYQDVSSTDFSGWNGEPWNYRLPWMKPSGKFTDPVAQQDRSYSGTFYYADNDYYAGNDRLETILVTGSRIRRADIFFAGEKPIRGVVSQTRRPAPGAVNNTRSLFTDTALWIPDLHLLPGEERTLAVKLPDNLTRWRAMVWSSDADDAFAMTDATVEAGQPLEVRVQAPIRIFEGDRAVIAGNVRQTGTSAITVNASMRSEGIGEPSEVFRKIALGANGQHGIHMTVSPVARGKLLTTVSATSAHLADSVVAATEVASPIVHTRKVISGWLGESGHQLKIPERPATASDAKISLQIALGYEGSLSRWIQDLRDYPHRCWEQMLSRALGAAIARERDGMLWLDADAVIREALDNAAVFQTDDGDFRYFAQSHDAVSYTSERQQIALTAYSIEALRHLQTLGYKIAPGIIENAETFLREFANTDANTKDANDLAFAMSALENLDATDINAIYARWHSLTTPSQLATASMLAKQSHPDAKNALSRLLDLAPIRGQSRTFKSKALGDRWMGSDISAQCTMIGLLQEHPELADRTTTSQLVRGMTDLFAGGIQGLDTQASARCLLAFDARTTSTASEAHSVDLQFGVEQRAFSLDGKTPGISWTSALGNQSVLGIVPRGTTSDLSWVAEIEYTEDAHAVGETGVGLAIERRYEVLRNKAWTTLEGQTVREGDWLRITLKIDSAAPRYFVALTDSVPGGFQPSDLNLNGVAGLELRRVSDEGSYYFATRRLDPKSPRFYAEHLPSGTHFVHYFARAGNAGDFLSLPAEAELMYGNSSRARTTATRIRIESALGR